MIDLQTALSEPKGIRLKIAKQCGITHGAVWQWKRVPAERVIDVERVTGIPRHLLRPDIFPNPAHEENAA